MTLTVQEVTAQEGDFWGKVGQVRYFVPTCQICYPDGFPSAGTYYREERKAQYEARTHVCSTPAPEPQYSDEWCDWADSESGKIRYPAAHKYSSYLRQIPFEHRSRAIAIAHTEMNLGGGRMSENLYYVVQELKDKNYGETVAEKTAREYREQDQAMRNATFQAQVATYKS
jgi:hypothetical protein